MIKDTPREKQKIKEKADALETQVRLIMHGVPANWVMSATAENLEVLAEILQRDTEQNATLNSGKLAELLGSMF